MTLPFIHSLNVFYASAAFDNGIVTSFLRYCMDIYEKRNPDAIASMKSTIPAVSGFRNSFCGLSATIAAKKIGSK